MTFREAIKQKLTECGLADNEADEVLKLAETDKVISDNFKNRWSDKTDGYPPMILNLIWLSIKRVALEWCEVNCPKAWFKPLFIGE